jgi:SHAQKYF class myb-like DNA-binding protein
MSLIDSESMPSLFLDSFTNSLFLPTNLSDNLNDISFESKKDIVNPSKQIKFVLTKDESPSINLLQKKTLSKINESKSDQNNVNGGRWNRDEQKRFAEAVLKFGNDWKKIQNHIFSRNITQVRSHAQKFLMKLKENSFAQNKGVTQSMSWTKTMNYLRTILSYDELKEMLFSVEQNDESKNEKKKSKKYKKNRKLDKNESNLDYSGLNSSYNTNIGNEHFFFNDKEDIYKYKYNLKKKIIIKEENEEEILKKFIECFNSSSGDITLNTSFEEESSKENGSDINIY